MKMPLRAVALYLLAGWVAGQGFVRAHESFGRVGHKEGDEAQALEMDFFAGSDGYLHGGIGLLQPLGDDYKTGLTLHLVREETGGSWFPSLGGELGKRFENGMEVELFSFGYFPVEDQHAWAGGARIVKALELSDEWTLTPFVGPTFARVRAVDQTTGNAVAVSHTMLLGGLLIERGPVEFGIFGTHSWFSRGTRALETHVDLEEMTHLAAYENNDGFARDSVGGEATWDATKRIQLSARYAAIFFPGESARHSVTVLPSVQIAERLRVSAGAQWLKGAGFDRVLFACAFAWEF